MFKVILDNTWSLRQSGLQETLSQKTNKQRDRQTNTCPWTSQGNMNSKSGRLMCERVSTSWGLAKKLGEKIVPQIRGNCYG